MAWRSTLMKYLESRFKSEVEGDFLEFGTLAGDLTIPLAKLAAKHERKVITVDVCDVSVDDTVTSRGKNLSDYYAGFVGRHNQEKIIRKKLQRLDNVLFIKENSVNLQVPLDQKLSVVVVDGGHQLAVFRHDARLGWSHLSVGGMMAIHDYKGDVPGLTEAIDQIVQEFNVSPENLVVLDDRWIVLEKK